MKVNVENISSVKKVLHIEEKSSIIDKEEKIILKELARNRKFPGFRPGKIPTSILKKMLGDEIVENSLNSAIDKLSKQAVEQEKLNPIGNIEEKDVKIENGMLRFSITFEVLPEFDIMDIDLLEIEKPIYKMDNILVEKRLKLFQSRSSYLETVDRPSKPNDFVIIDLDTTDNEGNTIEDLCFKGLSLEISKKTFWDGFTDKLQGVEKENEIEYVFHIPENDEKYPDKDLKFSIKVNEVKKKILPEIDDDFAKDYGFKSLDEMKNYINKEIEEELKIKNNKEFEENLLKELEERHSIEVPNILIEKEIETLTEMFKKHMKFEKNSEALKAEFEELAIKKVKQYIILDKISEKHNISPTEEEINKTLIEAIGQKVGYDKITKPTIKKMTNDWEFVRDVFWDVKRRKTLEKIKDIIKIKEIVKNVND